ncbi:DUF2523 domain-containing protein [Chitinimonas lacunae]|uniref:DUF2523 domain-containing protein n=1 Tax=Chitinimonas lacunae TaxID=1963018 RepID=A0ABV8MJY3_9NEIS
MPLFMAMLGGLLVSLVENIVARAITALGIGFVAYTGADLVLEQAKGLVRSNLAGLPVEVVAIGSMMGVGTALTIVFSAYATRMALMGIKSGGSWVRSHYGAAK